MSAVIFTPTPFIDKELLCRALQSLNVAFVKGTALNLPALITEREDHYGKQAFVLRDGAYVLTHDSSAQGMSYAYRKKNWQHYRNVPEFLKAVEKAYNTCYQERIHQLERLAAEQAEAERIRIENERIAYVEAQKAAIIVRAKAQGYVVQEKKANNAIQLVLIKNTY
jgi:hypothetical protein